MQYSPDTPIGCRGPNDGTHTCEISWSIVNDQDCLQTGQGNPHPLCGHRVRGLTVAGLMYYGSWSSAKYSLSYNYSYSNEPYYGTKVMVEGYEQQNMYIPLKAQFGPASFPGHAIWNGYVLPNMQVIYVPIIQMTRLVQSKLNDIFKFLVSTEALEPGGI